ncbi:MAG: hypothetical protein LBQ54_00085 [Planctomycetaceae bacterium]|nr:hypothetical protein [Planctomycetaceae bacterium]
MKHYILSITVLCLTFIGCSRQSVPDGFPAKLVPVTITITKAGTPVAGASVSLLEEQPAKYFILGNADATGMATPETSINAYSRLGVPPGKYRMTVSMRLISTIEDPPMEASDAERKAVQAKKDKELVEWTKKNPVPPDWPDISKTPLQLTISDKGGDFKVEIDAPGTFTQ